MQFSKCGVMLCPNEDAMKQIQNIKIVSELMCVTSKSAMWCCVQIKTPCSAEHFQLPTSPLGQYCVLSPAYLQRSREVRCTYPKNMQNSTLDNATKYQIQNVKRALNVMKRPESKWALHATWCHELWCPSSCVTCLRVQ